MLTYYFVGDCFIIRVCLLPLRKTSVYMEQKSVIVNFRVSLSRKGELDSKALAENRSLGNYIESRLFGNSNQEGLLRSAAGMTVPVRPQSIPVSDAHDGYSIVWVTQNLEAVRVMEGVAKLLDGKKYFDTISKLKAILGEHDFPA